MSISTARRSYAVHSVETASPGARLLLILDQLEASFTRAEQGYDKEDLWEIHCGLKNSQTIIALLRDSLQLDTWEGAMDVRTLYEFAISALVRSNIYKDRALFNDATEVMQPLMNAWRQAVHVVETGEYREPQP